MVAPTRPETNEKPLEALAGASPEDMDHLLQFLQKEGEVIAAAQSHQEREQLVKDRLKTYSIGGNVVAEAAVLSPEVVRILGTSISGIAVAGAISPLGLGVIALIGTAGITAKLWLPHLPGTYFSADTTRENLAEAERALASAKNSVQIHMQAGKKISLTFLTKTVQQYTEDPDMSPAQKQAAAAFLVRGIAKACQAQGVSLDEVQADLIRSAEYVNRLLQVDPGDAAAAAEAQRVLEELDPETAAQLNSCVEALTKKEAAENDATTFRAYKEGCKTVRLLGALTGSQALVTLADTTSHTLDMERVLNELTENPVNMTTPERWLAGLTITNSLLSCVALLMPTAKSLEAIFVEKIDALHDLMGKMSAEMQHAIQAATETLREEIQKAYQDLSEQIANFEQRTEVIQYRRHTEALAVQRRTLTLMEEVRALVQAHDARLNVNLVELIAQIDLEIRGGNFGFLTQTSLETARREYDRLVAGIRQCQTNAEVIPTELENKLQFLKVTEESPDKWAMRLIRFFMHRENQRELPEGETTYTEALEQSLRPNSDNFVGAYEGNPRVLAALQQLRDAIPPENSSALATNTAQPHTWLVIATYLQIYLESLPRRVRQQLSLHEGSVLNPATNYLSAVGFVREKAPEAHERNVTTYRAHIAELRHCFTQTMEALLSKKLAAGQRALVTQLKDGATPFNATEMTVKINSLIPSITLCPEPDHPVGEPLGYTLLGALALGLVTGGVGLIPGAAAGAAVGVKSVEGKRQSNRHTKKEYNNLLKQPGDGLPAPLFKHHADRIKRILGMNVAPSVKCDKLLRQISNDNPDFRGVFNEDFYKVFAPLRVMHVVPSSGPDKPKYLLELPNRVSKKIWSLILQDKDSLQIIVMSLLGLGTIEIRAGLSTNFRLTLLFEYKLGGKHVWTLDGHFSSHPYPIGPTSTNSTIPEAWETTFRKLRTGVEDPRKEFNIDLTAALLSLYGSLTPDASREARAQEITISSITRLPRNGGPRVQARMRRHRESQTELRKEQLVRLQEIAVGYMQAYSEAPTDDLVLDNAATVHRQYVATLAQLELMRLETSGISTLVGKRAHQWPSVEALLEGYKTALAPYNTDGLGFSDTPCQFQDRGAPPLTQEIQERIGALEELFRRIQTETPAPNTSESDETGGNLAVIGRYLPRDLQELPAAQRDAVREQLAAAIDAETERRAAFDDRMKTLFQELDAADGVDATVVRLEATGPRIASTSRYRVVGGAKPPGSATGGPRVERESDAEARATM